MRIQWSRWMAVFLAGSCVSSQAAPPPRVKVAAPTSNGVPVHYTLPADGPLPRTYRVSLAVVDPKNPDWIISQFAPGLVRTVTVENKGEFDELWNGLDDNYMPVPPGEYALKGIFMPAEKWTVDGEYHSVVPRYVSSASSFAPPVDKATQPEPFHGDPVNSPMGDIAVSPNGIAVFYYQYLENGLNNPMIDLRKPVGPEQFMKAFPSGSAAGGTSTTTDGTTVWSYSTDGGLPFVYRADQKRFGTGKGNSRLDLSYHPEGSVTAMANTLAKSSNKPLVLVAERGKLVMQQTRLHTRHVEDIKQPIDRVTVLDGINGSTLGTVPIAGPRGLAVAGETLYALHTRDDGFAVSRTALRDGMPDSKWELVVDLGENKNPIGLAVDGHGHIYVSDPAADQVVQYDATGKLLRRYGTPGGQKANAYDPLALMDPGKLAAWTDETGQDRLLILEHAGINRISEWNAEGKFLRDWMSLQTRANDGYAIDPEHPEDVYLMGHRNWLTRFKVDNAKGTWKVDAVWPNVGNDPVAPGLSMPRLLRHNGVMYLAGARRDGIGTHSDTYNIFRFTGTTWVHSAAIIGERIDNKRKMFFWHDANNDGRVQEEEYKNSPANEPTGLFRYHGERWLEDFSMLGIAMSSKDVWRLVPTGWDPHGNPILGNWEKIITDPVFTAREAGTADALHGGNELDNRFSSDWALADGSPAEGYYVQARGGKAFSANEGAQVKISRYVPDGKNGYRLLWRTGRAAIQGIAQPSEIYGAIQIRKPINGLLSVVDQTRCGVLLYTQEGMYVDTLFPDGRKFNSQTVGLYALPGEFFGGDVQADRTTGKIMIAMGKYTPLLFETVGWSLTENPVRPLTTLPPKITLAAPQIAPPPEIAVVLRGGAGEARVARIAPALGGANLDGSMEGWEAVNPATFRADKDQVVEARCSYDPEHLYVRWHVRLATPLEPRPLQPVERIFTHDRLSDTVSLYVQGDVNAAPSKSRDGRPGDARIVFGLFKDGSAVVPVALGMYPTWPDKATAKPMTYRTPLGTVNFAHVAPVAGAELHHVIDADRKGFVIAAALPRTAFPGLPELGPSLRTLVNFEATLGGHNKFWWANSDGSANRETYDEPTEARLYPGSWAPLQFDNIERGVTPMHWLICGPFGGPGAENFSWNGDQLMKDAAKKLYEPAVYGPDAGFDAKAVYTGPQITGYWNDPKANRWKPAEVPGLDNRVELGKGFQVWYGVTWVRAPEAMTLDADLTANAMTSMRWFVNGKPLEAGKLNNVKDRQAVIAAKAKLPLEAGWNEIRFRAYCVGYSPLRTGVTFTGPLDQLWKLRLSGKPPADR